MLNKILVLLIAVSLLAESPKWTLADVKVAHTQKNYVELVEHILDVTPSNRDKFWALAFKDTINYQIDSVQPGDRFLVNLDTLEFLKQVLPKEEMDSTFLVKIGKFLRLNSNNYSVAIPWFANALNAENKSTLCADEDLKLSVIAALSLPESEQALIKPALAILELCWDNLKGDVKSGFSDATAYYYKNVCKIYLEREANTSGLVTAACAESSEK